MDWVVVGNLTGNGDAFSFCFELGIFSALFLTESWKFWPFVNQ